MADGTVVSEEKKELTKRDRAFLGQLPDDFLRVQEVPRAEQSTHSGHRDQPHLVPMSFSPQAGDVNNVGKLKVTIAQAKLVKNYGLTRMDPYCRVRVGHAVYETPTDVNGGKNPRWNKSFTCNFNRGITSLYVEIFNERYLSLDDRIAWGYYEFNDDLFTGETVEEWISLTGKQGDEKEGNVNLILSLQKVQSNYYTTYSGSSPPMVAQPGPYNPYQQMPPQGYVQPGYVQQPAGYIQQPAGYVQQPAGFVQQPRQLPPSQPPPTRQITDQDVKQVQEMFPTVEEEVVRSVLEACHGNTDQAVSNLLSMTAT